MRRSPGGNTGIGAAWGEHGRGAAWLTLGIGATFALGLALQLVGLRVLPEADYATFVLALSIGNVASAVAAAVQPVVSVRASGTDAAFLPAAAGRTVLVMLAVTGVAAALLAPGIGWPVALLACLQVPLHALLGVGSGRLQAAHAFRAIAVSLVLLSTVRLVAVVPSGRDGSATAIVFAAALPLALIAALVVVAARGGFRGIPVAAAADGAALLRQYALWVLVAWLINADAVYARLRLPDADAGHYALAFTLGRQPLYAVAPLAMVLLPVARAGHPAEGRGRLRALLAVSGLLAAGTLLLLAPRPDALVVLLAGSDALADPLLIRGYALIGSLAAAATLLLTFAFARDHPPRLGRLAAIAVVGGGTAIGWVDSPRELLAVQAVTVAALTAACYAAARRSIE